MTGRTRPVVVAGLPRSGTTWALTALGTSPGCRAVPEPDNEDNVPSAIHAKHRHGRYPVLGPGEAADAYRRLWEWVFAGAYETRRVTLARRILAPGSRSRIFEGTPDLAARFAGVLSRDPRGGRPPTARSADRRIIAKSIHAELALDWLASEFDVDVLVLLRHPANVLASWSEVKLKDSRNSTLETRPEIRTRYLEPWGVPQPGADPVERMCWRIGLLTAALEDSISRNPHWIVRSHEELCVRPEEEFRRLYAELGLEWSERTGEYLESHNTPGRGFAVKRLAAEMPNSWESRLDDDQLATLRRVLAWFPITTWTESDLERTSSR